MPGRFHAQWEPVRNLSQLPSFAYSVPYAQLLLAEAATDTAEADKLRQQVMMIWDGTGRRWDGGTLPLAIAYDRRVDIVDAL